MGFRFRKSAKIGPFRVTASKSGLSYSVGGKGYRVTKQANGKVRKTYSIPGTGISYSETAGSTKKKQKKQRVQGYVPPSKTPGYEDTAQERNASPTGPKKHRKKRTIILAVVIALLFCSCVAALSDEDDASTPAAASTSAMSSEPAEASASSPASDPAKSTATEKGTSEKPKANTSEMVNHIARQAKADAKDASEEDLHSAYLFICDNYQDCFDDNEAMEQMIYNGWLLEYAYEGNSDKIDYYNLGQDTEQLVKSVYCGAEKPEDQATEENISQIKTSISKIKAAADQKAKAQKSDKTASVSTDTKKKTTTSTSTNKKKKATPSTNTDTEKKETTSTSTNKKKKTTASTSAGSNQQTTTQKADGEARVWIPTNGGKKYHSRSGCSNMKNPQEVTISEAKSRGFTPCGRCY